MPNRSTAVLIAAAAALAVFVLPGCAPQSSSPGASTVAPSTTATLTPSSPTSTPEPAVPTTLVLGGESAVLATGDAPLGDYPYEGPADALLASLTSVLGQPERVVHENEKCVNDSVDSVWGGLTVSYLGMDPAGTSLVQFSVRGDAAGLIIESPHGARVGASWPEFAASIPDAPLTTGEYEGKTWVEVIDGIHSAWGDRAGTLVQTNDSATISFIGAPLDLGYDC